MLHVAVEEICTTKLRDGACPFLGGAAFKHEREVQWGLAGQTISERNTAKPSPLEVKDQDSLFASHMYMMCTLISKRSA